MKKEWMILLIIGICLFLIISVAAENLTLPKPPKSPYTPNGSSQGSSGSVATGVIDNSSLSQTTNNEKGSDNSFFVGVIIFIIIVILIILALFFLFNKLNTKKSQSSVVVSVLLIIVAITAIVLVGTFTIKMVKDNSKYAHFDVALSIDSSGTYYSDSSGNIKDVYVRLKRGADKINLTGVILLFYSAGEAKIACNITPSEVVSLPIGFESRTYFFNSLVKPSEIQIYPIVFDSGENKVSQASDKSAIGLWNNKTNIKSSDFDPLLNCIAVGGPGGSGNGPGNIGFP